MAILKREGNRLIREYDGEKLWIEPWGGSALRVRCTRCYNMDESQDWALLPCEGGEAKITIDGQEAAIQNGGITAKIEKSGKVLFYNRQGGLLLEEYLRTEEAVGGFNSLLKVKARDLRPVIGGEYSLTMRFESKRDERLYGMGQYQQSILNLKGATLELAQRNSQASVPFLLSDAGYGFLWNNPAIGRATFGTNLTEWEAKSTQQLDYWICAGDAPAEIVERYSAATGRPPMMPDYATGFWQCKLRYQTQEELLQVAREYKRRGLPLSVIVIDYFHWPNQGTWQFDREYWPDPEGMVRELRELGVELMVSVWPTVDSESPNFPIMLERGLLAQTDRGVRTQMQFLGNETFFDATNPEAREFVWNECKKNYYDYGIRSFWLDAAEPEYSTYDFDLYRYSLGSNLKVGNIYPALYAKAFYDGLRREGEDPLMLIRCAWAGSQRYGTLVWSGDIHSSFESMRDQFAAGLSMSIAGIPWWTTDIGGFNGGDIHDPYFHEVLVRWFQYGAFCPVMRLHGSRLPWKEPLSDKVGGGMCSSGAENEVYSFGGPVYEICKDYMQLRERLRPYVTGLMAEAHKKGTPPMRPMFYDFPHQKEAWETEDQYMFGPDVLVAPVMYHGMRERSVWLPEGRAWIDTATGERFAGDQRIVCQAPIERMPVFCSNEALSITIRGSH